MTFVPIELKITEIVWDDNLKRWCATFDITNASNQIYLTDGDRLKITDRSKEYSVEFTIHSIEKLVPVQDVPK